MTDRIPTKLDYYKGYTGSINFYLEDDHLFGQVLYIHDAIIYQGDNLIELKQSFHDAVDEYLDTCQEMGKKPNEEDNDE